MCLATHGVIRLPWSLGPGSADLGVQRTFGATVHLCPVPVPAVQAQDRPSLSSATEVRVHLFVQTAVREEPWPRSPPGSRMHPGVTKVTGRPAFRAEIPALAWNYPLAAPAFPGAPTGPGVSVCGRTVRAVPRGASVQEAVSVQAGPQRVGADVGVGRTRRSAGTRQGCRSNWGCRGGAGEAGREPTLEDEARRRGRTGLEWGPSGARLAAQGILRGVRCGVMCRVGRSHGEL